MNARFPLTARAKRGVADIPRVPRGHRRQMERDSGQRGRPHGRGNGPGPAQKQQVRRRFAGPRKCVVHGALFVFRHVIRKSRYDSIDSYLSAGHELCNDVNLEVHEPIKARLQDAGVVFGVARLIIRIGRLYFCP